MSVQVIFVTGMSGAGRSTALRVLEDLGHYCVDNLPPALAPELLSLASKGGVSTICLGMDVRTKAFLEGVEETLEKVGSSGHEVQLLFLDCADSVLVRRYSETRRPHPLAPGGDLLGAIQMERERVAPLRAHASHVIDTTDLSVHDLRRAILDWRKDKDEGPSMVVRVVSFGFKYGVPVDADLVFDLRFLPNPHFVPELRPKTGLQREVADYVLSTEAARSLLADLEPLLHNLVPRYEAEGKAYLTIGIGCTGGRHRSVALAEELRKRLSVEDRTVRIAHRDIERGH